MPEQSSHTSPAGILPPPSANGSAPPPSAAALGTARITQLRRVMRRDRHRQQA
jgi:hypothetical protein